MDSLAVKRKNAVGTTATASHFEQACNFEGVHKDMETKSAVLPLKDYMGHESGKGDDRFDRRIVPQLSDISFEADSEDDFEDVRNLKRQPMTVLTEENLKKILSGQTTKLNLEHAYWLKDNFLNKIGRLAPNLVTLSLRRVAISNDAFMGLFRGPHDQYLKQLKNLDICECAYIEHTGFIRALEENAGTLKRVQAANCQAAITDEAITAMNQLEDLNLEFLDISYNKLLSDEGLKTFEKKTYPLTHLIISGLGEQATTVGIGHMIKSAAKTLVHLEMALLRHEGMKDPALGLAVGACFELEYLDISGCREIDDSFFY